MCKRNNYFGNFENQPGIWTINMLLFSNDFDKICDKKNFTVHLRLTSYSHIKKEFGVPGFEFKG